jgi:transcriptional regulator with XRE-family HTH domain
MLEFSGKRLAAKRRAAGLTQVALVARTSGLRGLRALQNYESGTCAPPVNVALRLADVLKIHITDLLDDRLHAA